MNNEIWYIFYLLTTIQYIYYQHNFSCKSFFTSIIFKHLKKGLKTGVLNFHNQKNKTKFTVFAFFSFDSTFGNLNIPKHIPYVTLL